MSSNSASGAQDSGYTLVFVAFSTGVQCVVFFLLYWLLSAGGVSEAEESLMYFAFFSIAPLGSVIGFLAMAKAGARVSMATRSRLACMVLTTVPLSIVVFALLHMHKLVYYTYEIPPPALPLSNIRFLLGIVCFVLVAAALARMLGVSRGNGKRLQPDGPIPDATRFIGIALVISLVDVYMMMDSASFAPYIAPAFLVAEGQRPMIDTFSQYGPNFLIFALAFKVLPLSFFTMSAIVAVLNVLMYLTFLGIAVNISRNKTFAFVIAICTILFIHSAHLYNINYTPSVFAMRFFPPLLLIYTLSLLPVGRIFSTWTLSALVLCSLWALESLAFGLLAYSAFVLLHCIGNRILIAHCLRSLTVLFACVGLTHACVWAGYMLAYGLPPDYVTYLQLVLFHLEGGAYWNLPIEPGIMVWALFGFTYATMLALATHLSIFADRADPKGTRTNSIMGALSVLGVLMFYYYIGRSATPILMFISLPLFLIFIRTVDWAISNSTGKDHPSSADGTAARISLLAFMLVFPLMGGVFADKFFRPYSQHLSNSSLLRSVLSPKEKAVRLRERMLTWRSTVPSETYPSNEAGGSLTYTHPENLAAFELIRKYTQASSKVVLLIADPVPVIFHTLPGRRQAIAYPAHAEGLAYPAVDGLSSNLTERTFLVLKKVSANDVAIIGSLQRTKLDDKVLDYLRRSWNLCKLEARTNVIAYRIRPLSDTACPL